MASTSVRPRDRRAFTQQRQSAKKRGIEWELSFEEWLRIWTGSGRFEKRGRGRGCYVMARRGDVGPYSLGNVSIQLYEENCRDARFNHAEAGLRGNLSRTGTGRGWCFRKSRYQVTIGRRYIGVFKTQAEAEAAYKVACERHLAAAGIC